MFELSRVRGSWAIGGMAGLVAIVLLGVGVLRPPGRLDVFLEPAGAAGSDPFLVLESPDLRTGAAEFLSLGGGVTVRVGIEPGLYGGSGSDHLCDPQLIADFLAEDSTKASAWASAAGIDEAEIDAFLLSLTPVRLLADTWVTNHGYRDGQATPRQSILQAGTMVLVDDLGVPRVRCKCGNPLLPPEVPDDLDSVSFVGEAWEGFNPNRLLEIEAGAAPVEAFILVRLEDGRLIARPVGTSGDQDVLVDEGGRWIPELGLVLPSAAAVGDGPFALPDITSAGFGIEYTARGPCRIARGELILDGEGICVLSAVSEANGPWGKLEIEYEIDVGVLDQVIVVAALDRIVLGEEPVALEASADSMLPVEYAAVGPCEVVDGTLIASGVGTCEVTIRQSGNARWGPAEPVVITVEITGGTPRQTVAITFDLPASLRLDDGPVTLAARAAPARPLTYLVSGACDLDSGNVLRARTVGECEVQAVAAGNDDFQRAIARKTITVRPRIQQVGLDSLPRVAVVSDTVVPLPATTSAGFDVRYAVSGACRLAAGGLLFTGAGTCEVTGSADGDAETEPVTETFEITVSVSAVQRQTQSITFGQPASLAFGGGGATLGASATSGLAVTLTVVEGNCSLQGKTLSPGDAGRCTVTASQNGDLDYLPADSVTRTVTVAKATPTLTISVAGGSATEMLEGQSRTVTGVVSSGPSAAITGTTGPCTASGDVVSVSGSGSGACGVTVAAPGDVNHGAVSGSVTIGVKRLQTVSVTLPSRSLIVGQQLQPTASASSGLQVAVGAGPSGVCTFSGGVVTAVAPGTCTVTADQAGNAEFAAASGSASLTVQAKRSPVINIDAPSSMSVGDQITVKASSTEPGVVVTIAFSGAACRDLGRGTVGAVARGTCTVKATHPASSEAEAGSATATIDVVGLTDGISFDCGKSCTMQAGQSLTVVIRANSGLAIRASAQGSCTIVGEDPASGSHYVVLSGVSVGTCTLSASTAGDGQWNPASASQQLQVTGISTTLNFELGQTLAVGQTRSFDVAHNVPNKVVEPGITGSAACKASIDAVGHNAQVTGVADGLCTVTITIGGGNHTKVSRSDSAKVAIIG